MELILKYHRNKLLHLKATALMLGAINIALAACDLHHFVSGAFLIVLCISFVATSILFVGSIFDVIKESLGAKQFDATLNKVIGVMIMLTAVGKFLFASNHLNAGYFYIGIVSSLIFYGPLHLVIGWELRNPERTKPLSIMLEFKIKCEEDENSGGLLVNPVDNENDTYPSDPPPRYEAGSVLVGLNQGQPGHPENVIRHI